MRISPELRRSIVTFVVFQVVWTASVMGAGRGLPWLGPLSVVVLLPLLLPFAADRRCELRLWLVVGLVGTVVDSTLFSLGLIGFPRLDPAWPSWLVPLWITGLWIAYASMLRSCLAWLRPRPWLAALLGLVGGPFSFQAGCSLGAVSVPEPRWQGFLALALEWAVLTPLLLALAHRGGAAADGETSEAPPAARAPRRAS